MVTKHYLTSDADRVDEVGHKVGSFRHGTADNGSRSRSEGVLEEPLCDFTVRHALHEETAVHNETIGFRSERKRVSQNPIGNCTKNYEKKEKNIYNKAAGLKPLPAPEYNETVDSKLRWSGINLATIRKSRCLGLVHGLCSMLVRLNSFSVMRQEDVPGVRGGKDGACSEGHSLPSHNRLIP